jgi:hypothetical protein
VWICSRHRQRNILCPESVYQNETSIKRAFVAAYNKVHKNNAVFTNELFSENVEKVIFKSDTAVFYFTNGKKITETIPKYIRRKKGEVKNAKANISNSGDAPCGS